MSAKLLATILLCVVGLIYLSLLGQVWIDTEFKPAMIAEGYGEMEYMELTHHSHIYLPYYALYLFALPVGIFMFTAYSERLKRVFTVVPFILVVVDIASMWLTAYVHATLFAWVLWFAGTFLALTFLSLVVLNVYDIWLRRSKPVEPVAEGRGS